MTTDFSKPPEQILVDLINQKNGTNFRTDQFTFSAPQAVTAPGATRNTKVVITAIPATGVSGRMEVLYNRVNINTVPGNRSRVITKGSKTQLSEVVAAINLAYGINLTPADYVAGALPDVNVPATLTMKPTSLVFTGVLQYQLTEAAAPEQLFGAMLMANGGLSIAATPLLAAQQALVSLGLDPQDAVIAAFDNQAAVVYQKSQAAAWRADSQTTPLAVLLALAPGSSSTDNAQPIIWSNYVAQFGDALPFPAAAPAPAPATYYGAYGAEYSVIKNYPSPADAARQLVQFQGYPAEEAVIAPWPNSIYAAIYRTSAPATLIAGVAVQSSLDADYSALTSLLWTDYLAQFGDLLPWPAGVQTFSVSGPYGDNSAPYPTVQEAVQAAVNRAGVNGHLTNFSGTTAVSFEGLAAYYVTDQTTNAIPWLDGVYTTDTLTPVVAPPPAPPSTYYSSNAFFAQVHNALTPMAVAQGVMQVYALPVGHAVLAPNGIYVGVWQDNGTTRGTVAYDNVLLQPTVDLSVGTSWMLWSDYIAQFGDALPWQSPAPVTRYSITNHGDVAMDSLTPMEAAKKAIVALGYPADDAVLADWVGRVGLYRKGHPGELLDSSMVFVQVHLGTPGGGALMNWADYIAQFGDALPDTPPDLSSPLFTDSFAGAAGPVSGHVAEFGGQMLSDPNSTVEGSEYVLTGDGYLEATLSPENTRGGWIVSPELTTELVGYAVEVKVNVTDITPGGAHYLEFRLNALDELVGQLYRFTISPDGAAGVGNFSAQALTYVPSFDSLMLEMIDIPQLRNLQLGEVTLRFEIMPGLYRVYVDGVKVSEIRHDVYVPVSPTVGINYYADSGVPSWQFRDLKIDSFQAHDWVPAGPVFEGEFTATKTEHLLFTVFESAAGAAGVKLLKNDEEQPLTNVAMNGLSYVRFDGDVVQGDTVKITADKREEVVELHAEAYDIATTKPLPDNFFDGLRGLKVVRWHDCHVAGPLPSLRGAPKLEELDCFECNFTGSLPDLSKHAKLTYIDVSYNQFSGEVPMIAFSQVTDFIANNNQFSTLNTGAFPATIRNLDLSNNALNQNAVDNILMYLNGIGITDGTGRAVRLAGGTNAEPSFDGWDAVIALRAIGWTVEINGVQPAYNPTIYQGWLAGSGHVALSGLVSENASSTSNVMIKVGGAVKPNTPTLVAPGQYDMSWEGDVADWDYVQIRALDRSAVTRITLEQGLPFYGAADWSAYILPPSYLSGLVNLERLTLHGDELFDAGEVPAPTGLIKLELLDLKNSNRTGAIPSMGDLVALKTVDLSDNMLTDFTGTLPLSLESLKLNGNQLTEAAVDAILASLVDAGAVDNGFNTHLVMLDGGLNSALSQAGLASKATLESRGWQVIVNAVTPAAPAPLYAMTAYETATLDSSTPMEAAQKAIVSYGFTAADAALADWSGKTALHQKTDANNVINGSYVLKQRKAGSVIGAVPLSWSDYIAEFGDALPIAPPPPPPATTPMYPSGQYAIQGYGVTGDTVAHAIANYFINWGGAFDSFAWEVVDMGDGTAGFINPFGTNFLYYAGDGDNRVLLADAIGIHGVGPTILQDVPNTP